MSDKIRCRINDEPFVDSSDEEDANDKDFDEDHDDNENSYLRSDSLPCENDVKSLEDLPWFHGDISRNTAEALLLQNAGDGTYLLRCSDSSVGTFSVSVRCQNSVKHYKLEYDTYTKSYVFGMGQFPSLAELIDHFHCQPVLATVSGVQITLQHAYMRNVEEPNIYEIIVRHAEGGSEIDGVQEPLDFQIASKEGYLVKRGAILKSWKTRWFVLQKNLLKYYKRMENNDPIRSIDLRDATDVSEDFIDGKKNCFRLCLPERIFYFYAKCPDEAQDWMKMLQWKIDHYRKEIGKSATL